MKGFVGDIEALTLDNKSFRTVLYTGAHLQLVLTGNSLVRTGQCRNAAGP